MVDPMLTVLQLRVREEFFMQAPGQTAASGLVLHSVFDEYASSQDPNHVSLSQEHLRALLFAQGATEDTLLEAMETNNRQWREMLDRCGGQLPSMGFKPKPQDRSVQYYDIPRSPLAIRIWSGGMEGMGQYCFDFFHIRDGAMTFGGQLQPWEISFGINREDIRPGEEKYSVPEGSRLALLRDGEEPFYFRIPTRALEVPGIVFAEARR